MSILHFDGTDDGIQSSGSVPALTGTWTMAAIVDVDAVVTEQTRVIASGWLSGGGLAWGFYVYDNPPLSVNVWVGSGPVSVGPAVNLTDDFLIVVSDPGGANPLWWHLGNITQGTAMDHTDGTACPDMPGTTTGMRLGCYGISPANAPFSGDIGLVGIWDGVVFSDAQAEELAATARTSDWYNHSAGRPHNLIELNSTSPVDLGSVGTTWSVTGATATGADPTGGWAFDGAGQQLRPDADIVTTGWTTTPLYSKINDQSDATVITATLA